jgi:hypothetical protein
MSLDAGRSKLYSSLKTLLARWDVTVPYWQDAMRLQFEEQLLAPLQLQTEQALSAIDQLAVVLSLMRRDCEASNFDIFSNES